MRRIRYKFKRLRDCWGLAYPDEYRIELDPRMDEKTLMDIALHEGLHCIFPHIKETDIDNAGKTLAVLLWRLGFRKNDGD
jgi:hypothetical protein